MNGEGRPDIAARKAAVRQRLSLSAVVEPHVKLSGGPSSPKRRGQCPFHGSNSASLALFDATSGEGGAYCFGCQWRGDLFEFQRDIRGIGFMDALAELEGLAGISAASSTEGVGRQGTSGPVQRERNPARVSRPSRALVEPIDMARTMWRLGRPDLEAVRRYFLGRGVPEPALTDARLAPFRFLAECPCIPWEVPDGATASGCLSALRSARVPVAPALMALVRVPMVRGYGEGQFPGPEGRKAERPPEPLRGEPSGADAPRPAPEGGEIIWIPTGLHVTYLNPDGTGTMVRRKPWSSDDDPDPMLPKRRMLGPVGGGAIVLGEYRPDAHLYAGEGNETVLSAMGLADAPPAGVGVATLSLDNLQGAPKLWRGKTSGERIWPLFAIAPDPERPCFTIPGHRGRVTGLVDSDMKPLRGRRDPKTGEPRGELVVEHRGGPIVRRAITGAERARICGELLVKGWRAVGAHPVEAVRAALGMDFNDAARTLRQAQEAA